MLRHRHVIQAVPSPAQETHGKPTFEYRVWRSITLFSRLPSAEAEAISCLARLPTRSGRPEGDYELDKVSDVSEKSGTIFLVIWYKIDLQF